MLSSTSSSHSQHSQRPRPRPKQWEGLACVDEPRLDLVWLEEGFVQLDEASTNLGDINRRDILDGLVLV